MDIEEGFTKAIDIAYTLAVVTGRKYKVCKDQVNNIWEVKEMGSLGGRRCNGGTSNLPI